MKEKSDYPLVLTANHVSEIMGCAMSAARTYINTASSELRKRGKLPPTDVVKNARIPRDLFFDIYGI